MNAHKVMAMPPSEARAFVPSGSSPRAVSPVPASIPIVIDPRDQLLAAELRAIRYQGMAKRAAWALQGVSNALERTGYDVSYWRDLAVEIERGAA